MTYTPLFFIIIGIIIIDFLLERGLEMLNASWRNKPIPNELSGIYDDEKYRKQQEYSRVNSRFSLFTGTFSLVLTLVFLFVEGFAWVNNYLAQYFINPLWLGLFFFGIIFFLSDIIQIPFSIYDTFVIEERFGFNKTTPKIFILDKLKGYLLAIILGGLIYALVYWFFTKTGEWFWIYAWGAFTLFTIFMLMFYSNLIVPLFNKQKPLPEGELRDAINAFSQKAGFKLKNVYVIDGSKRSTRANAYFTGFGPKKRIVLYDTLINDLAVSEIVAVLAHEIGHYKKKHVFVSFLLSVIQMGIMLYLFSLFVSNPKLSQALGLDNPQFHVGLVAFALLYSPVSLVTGLFMNVLSRRNEYQADAFAGKQYHPGELISALKKLAAKNLSNLTPHPLYIWINHSHPSLYQRVCFLNSIKNSSSES